MIDKEKENRVLPGGPFNEDGGQEGAGASAQPPPQPAGEPSRPARPPSGAAVHAYIGRQLRAVYDDVAKQPVPERFLDLMKQLDAKTGPR